MKAPIVLAVALVAFAADASDAARAVELLVVGLLDVAVIGWALGGRRP